LVYLGQRNRVCPGRDIDLPLDREQRANGGLLLVVYGILHQLPPPAALLPAIPIWAIFFMALNESLRWILLPVVLLRFPERRLQKRYERIFIIVLAAGS
jgi:hypothetical protein